MTTIPTALLIIAGLIVILLIVRATKRPIAEDIKAEIDALKAERDFLRHCLNEMGDFLHIYGHRKQAERVQEVLSRPVISKLAPKSGRDLLAEKFAERENWD